MKKLIRSLLPNQLVNYFYHLPKAILANLVYLFPSRSLVIIGVTGTDGKTTISTLIHHILNQDDKKVALISTVEAKIGSKIIPTGLHVTSPSPFFLQKIIRQIKKNKIKYLVLETTSHGLDQFRVWGVKYTLGVLSNITHEHLDYHKTYQSYLKSKSLLLKKSKTAIINADDKSYFKVIKLLGKKPISYGLKQGDYSLKNLNIKTTLPGEYNLSNCLAAAAACLELGLDKVDVLKAIANFKGIKGRMDFISNNRGLGIVVDFAHTPNALKNVLKTLQKDKKGLLISIFGCAGLRDVNKRPQMGQISGSLADFTIITAEDPRTEDINKINASIVEGLKKVKAKKLAIDFNIKDIKTGQKYYFIIPDRQKAISFAINKLVGKGDIVGIFGKGHEQSLCFGTKECLWSDNRAVKKTLKGDK